LKLAFPRLYNLSSNKTGRVCDFYKNGRWFLKFRRALGHQDLVVWEALMDLLEEVHLNNSHDVVKWALEKSGTFTTKSMYRWLSHRGVINKRLQHIWQSRLPMKLKVFLWQISHNRLQTGVVLKKRNWKGNHLCNICGQPETADHIFFECIVARFLWVCFKEALGWDRAPTGW